MNIKAIVKVMNFHALLRVDRAHKEADQYQMLEREVARMVDIIQNNRNFILDRWVLQPKEGAPRLRIYIGSDMGFCGAVNASVNSVLDKEAPENTVISIGRKLHQRGTVTLSVTRDEFEPRYAEIEALLAEAVRKRKYSGIDIIYDHYYNMSHIELLEKTIFPVEFERSTQETYKEDFSVEGGDVNELMEELLITYLNYKVKSAAVNAFASENILRQNATNESLKRIDEMEERALWAERKERNLVAARRVIDSYTKTKYRAE
ncbi:MAG: F0F1 ATP synthase subunit gamma [Oscillospiraceae bacterium]|nr:F0F1 ATP synthase subunit gamma [Oscillospiraceae bacterium]